LKGLVLVLVPISALTIVLTQPIIYFVFSHTRLRATDFLATASALAIFSVGIFARGAQTLVSRGFNATNDTVTPAVVGTVFTFLTLPLYWYCGRRWDYLGLAAASSLAIIFYAIVLFVLLARRTRNRRVGEFLTCLAKVSLASALVAMLCSRLTAWLEMRVAWHTPLGSLKILVIVTAIGLPFIFLLAKTMGVVEIENYCKKLIPVRLGRVVEAPE
jgi:putative peptidoglycan lipid II flippase